MVDKSVMAATAGLGNTTNDINDKMVMALLNDMLVAGIMFMVVVFVEVVRAVVATMWAVVVAVAVPSRSGDASVPLERLILVASNAE